MDKIPTTIQCSSCKMYEIYERLELNYSNQLVCQDKKKCSYNQITLKCGHYLDELMKSSDDIQIFDHIDSLFNNIMDF